MASPFFISGPFSGLFIGAASGASPLQAITIETTGAFSFREEIPKEWTQCTGSYEQSGAKVVTLNLSFLSIDELAIKISRGLALNASTVYGTPTGQKYAVLLTDGEDFTTNLWLPCVESIGPFGFNRDKNNQSQIDINLSYQAPDLDTLLWAMGDFTDLQPLMGAQYPF